MLLVGVSAVLAGCGAEYRLVPLRGAYPFIGTSDPGVFGFEGDGHPLPIRRSMARVWRDGQWHENRGGPTSVCEMRHNPAEGALAFNERMMRWQDGAFVPISPPYRSPDGCAAEFAATENGRGCL
jgi:hypothetical protein